MIAAIPTDIAYVRAMRMETPEILTLELEPETTTWHGATAGSHIDVDVPGVGLRQYSLMPGLADGSWRIAIRNDSEGRGGSRWVHTTLRPGQRLRVSTPRNLFELDTTDAPACLVAGGVGITPILAMAHALARTSRVWQLHYSVRSADRLAFAAELSGWGEHIRLYIGDGAADRIDLSRVVAASAPGTHFYCCGPVGMLEAFANATAALDPTCVHREYFAAPAAAGAEDAGSFVVELARSGGSCTVRADQTILDALLDRGMDIPHSCRSGVCGSCETRIVGGTADHRDVVLSPAERADGKSLMLCCSRARSNVLVLDL